jgi:hypothetical protein
MLMLRWRARLHQAPNHSARIPIGLRALFREIAVLRERTLAVHYCEEYHWLAAAVSFREMCRSAKAQEVLRRVATIAWQFGFPAVSNWVSSESRYMANGTRSVGLEVW